MLKLNFLNNGFNYCNLLKHDNIKNHKLIMESTKEKEEIDPERKNPNEFNSISLTQHEKEAIHKEKECQKKKEEKNIN